MYLINDGSVHFTIETLNDFIARFHFIVNPYNYSSMIALISLLWQLFKMHFDKVTFFMPLSNKKSGIGSKKNLLLNGKHAKICNVLASQALYF